MKLQERLLDEVVLVPCVGEREARRLCVMSLVAEWAGEAHGDRPICASPVVRGYAVALNDCLPDDCRQLLKPFAPVIVGTQDTADRERRALLLDAVLEDVAPAGLRALLGSGTARESETAQVLLHGWPSWACASSNELLGVLASGKASASPFLSALNGVISRFVEADDEAFGKAVGKLLGHAADVQPTERGRRRVWLMGIDMLDRISSLRGDWMDSDFSSGEDTRTLVSRSAAS